MTIMLLCSQNGTTTIGSEGTHPITDISKSYDVQVWLGEAHCTSCAVINAVITDMVG